MKHPKIFTAQLIFLFVAAMRVWAAPADVPAAVAEIERESVDFMIDQSVRLSDVGYKLLAAIPARGDGAVHAALPFVFLDFNSKPKPLHDQSDPEKVIVGDLIPYFKSDLDIRRGDRILRFQGMTVESSAQLRDYVKSVRDVSYALIRFARGGKETDIKVPLHYFNFGGSFVARSKSAQAYSEWTVEGIAVSPPLIKMAANEAELAYVLAHEIAHGILRHRRTQVSDTTANAVSNLVGSAMAAALNVAPTPQPWQFKEGPYLETSEVDADYAAMTYLKNAGFDPRVAYDFLQKEELELKRSGEGSQRHVHPLSVDRLALVKKKFGELAAAPAETVASVVSPALVPGSAEEGLGADFSGGADPVAAKVSHIGLAESVRYSFGYDNEIKPQDALIFTTKTPRIVWHAEDDADKGLFNYRELRVEWYRPDGELYHVDKGTNSNVDDTFRSGISLKEEEAEKNVGRWKVRVTHEKQVVDERSFLIKDTRAKMLKRRSEIHKGGVS